VEGWSKSKLDRSTTVGFENWLGELDEKISKGKLEGEIDKVVLRLGGQG
jgi:hypothetical protein